MHGVLSLSVCEFAHWTLQFSFVFHSQKVFQLRHKILRHQNLSAFTAEEKHEDVSNSTIQTFAMIPLQSNGIMAKFRTAGDDAPSKFLLMVNKDQTIISVLFL